MLGPIWTGLAESYSYDTRHVFGSANSLPQAGLVQGDDGWLYGTTSGKVTGRGATVFKFPGFSPSYGYARLKSFAESEGITIGAITVTGATVYGVAYSGGSVNLGTLFKLRTDGSGFSVMKDFTNSASEGANPWGGMVLAGARLYGTTVTGGSQNHGTVFSIGTNGESYGVLKHFAYDDGANPEGTLILSGTTLFGTTVGGGGTVFKINTDGSGFAVLKKFYTAYGPRSGLILYDKTLYGSVWQGGASGDGFVFKLETDGSDYAVLKEFSYADGSLPRGPLLLSGEILFGTTQSGGQFGDGTVFMMPRNGTGHSVLHHFGGSEFDGVSPRGAVALSGKTLFGTTAVGGSQWDGVLFSLIPPSPPAIQAPPETQTAEIGCAVRFSVLTTGSPPLSYQWLFNHADIISGLSANSWLDLTNLQSNHSGPYSVIVTNNLWAVTSVPAMLNVIAAVQQRQVPVIRLTSETGSALQLDCADALGTETIWSPLAEITLTSTSQLHFDATKPLLPQRFYRAWHTQASGHAPVLKMLNAINAVTLTGSIGDSVRVDTINAVGPTERVGDARNRGVDQLTAALFRYLIVRSTAAALPPCPDAVKAPLPPQFRRALESLQQQRIRSRKLVLIQLGNIHPFQGRATESFRFIAFPAAAIEFEMNSFFRIGVSDAF